jgi:putative sterol carrier protein
MSEIVDAAVKALNVKLGGAGIDGSVRFVIEDEGAVRIDETGATADSGTDADCTLTASAETFQSLLDGDLDPTGAFMSGRLTVDGDMGLAMRLGSLLG